MGTDDRPEVIQIPGQTQKSLLDHPFVREIGTDLIKQYAKQQLGLKSSGNENKNAKGPVTRLVYSIRDLAQGTWWVVLLLYLGLGLGSVLIAIIKKMAGV